MRLLLVARGRMWAAVGTMRPSAASTSAAGFARCWRGGPPATPRVRPSAGFPPRVAGVVRFSQDDTPRSERENRGGREDQGRERRENFGGRVHARVEGWADGPHVRKPIGRFTAEPGRPPSAPSSAGSWPVSRLSGG